MCPATFLLLAGLMNYRLPKLQFVRVWALNFLLIYLWFKCVGLWCTYNLLNLVNRLLNASYFRSSMLPCFLLGWICHIRCCRSAFAPSPFIRLYSPHTYCLYDGVLPFDLQMLCRLSPSHLSDLIPKHDTNSSFPVTPDTLSPCTANIIFSLASHAALQPTLPSACPTYRQHKHLCRRQPCPPFSS